MLAYEAACANGAPGVETKRTKLAGMKAIRSDNDRREMERGDRPSRGRRRRWQITAKLLMTQTPSGVEEMCQLVRERCCSLSKLAPARKSSSAGSTASFLTALHHRAAQRGRSRAISETATGQFRAQLSLHWSVAMCQHAARSEYQRTTTGNGSRVGL